MPVSADAVLLGIIEEAIAGTTPANPAFDLIRTTGESVAFAPTVTNSAELNPGRGVTDSILTGAEVTGDINFELSKNPAFENLLEGAMASDWGDTLGYTIAGWDADDILIGEERKTYTYTKEFDLDAGLVSIHNYKGLTIGGFTLAITPGEPITGSFAVVGQTLDLLDARLAGQTMVPAGVFPVFTAPLVVTGQFLETDLVTPLPIAINTHCFTGININLNNNARGIQCIGTLGTKETVLGKAEVTVATTIYFADDELLQMLIDQTEFALKFVLRDSVPIPNKHEYQFVFTRCKLTTAPVVAGGTGQDVVADCNIACLVPANPPYSPLLIQRRTIAA